MHRRELLTTFATAGATAAATMASGEPTLAADDNAAVPRVHRASFIEGHDGANLYWREWGRGVPVLFVHSWCMNSQMWDYQFAALGHRGMRCIAYDRRGHGRSDQPPTGYDYDTLADDMASVIEALELHDLTLVGHSMGAAEIVRYLSRQVAANAAAFLVCFERRSGGAGVLIAEDYVIVHEVADRLHPRPTKRSVSEEPPSLVGQTIGLTVTTAKQKQYDFCRQVLNLVLQSVQIDRVRHARVHE